MSDKKRETRIKDMSYTSMKDDRPLINQMNFKTKITGMGGVQRRVGEYSRIINTKENGK